MSVMEDVERALEAMGGGDPAPEDGQGKSWVEFTTSQLSKLLVPFVQSRKAGRDIISKCVLLVPQDGLVWIYATDGVAHLRARVPAKLYNFTRPMVINLDSLITLVKGGPEKTVLFWEGEHVYGQFYGGQLFIPTFGFQEKLFRGSVSREGEPEEEGNKSTYEDALATLPRIIESSDIPELGFVFLTSQGAYAASGSMVGKVHGKFADITLRHRDCSLFRLVLETHPGTTFWVKKFKKQILVRTDFLDYVFPRIEIRFPERYTHRVEAGPARNCFKIHQPGVDRLLRLLAGIPDASGVLALHFSRVLRGESRTKKGHTSDFEVSRQLEGPEFDTKVQTMIKVFLLALGAFKGAEELALSVGVEGSLVMWDDAKILSFLTRPGL